MSKAKEEYYVKDLVIDDEYGIVDSGASVKDAASKMKELGVPDLVVVEKASKDVLGVIADFDIVQNVVAEGKDAAKEKVDSVMYQIEPVTLNTSVSEAFAKMRDLQVNVVPVLDGTKLVGVCSIQDCWSFIPDETPDIVGFIPTKNPNLAEFWFASVCAILAFVLGVVLPLAGIFGFFIASQSDIMALLGIADARGGTADFFLFDVLGVDFFVPLLSFSNRGGPIWILIPVFSVLIIIFGILGLLSLIYTSYTDIKNIQTGFLVRLVIPLIWVLLLVFQWIFFGIGFVTAPVAIEVSIDGVGLTMSIVSMILILLAINREYIFVQKKGVTG